MNFDTPPISEKKTAPSLEKVHLREDIPPITGELVEIDSENAGLDALRNRRENGTWVDFDGGDLDGLEAQGFKHAGAYSYLISPIDEKEWHSDHYMSCTAVVGIGRDKITGKEVSFLSHQDPNYFVDGTPDEVQTFSQAMSASLKELQDRSAQDTVEVLILGGNFNPGTLSNDAYKSTQYKQSIQRLGEIVQKTLGFDPKVLSGPNSIIGSETQVTIETQERKVWVERPNQPTEFDQPYQASTIDDVERTWL